MPTIQSRNTLILDDDPFFSEMVASILYEFGIQKVIIESKPKQALQIIKQQQIDVTIVDLAIPDMDGIEFLKHLAQRGYDGDIIVLSGMNSAVLKAADNLATANGLQVIGTFQKPVSPKDLQDAFAKRILA
jgi:CheY-like chemotaxis protein